MRAAFLLLALAACEHATADQKKPPEPPKPDPVEQARAEFDLLAPDYAVGTSKLYSRGSFLPDSADMAAGFDEGDFTGRLRTLFGPRADDDYVLRHKKTGFIITAYSGDSGPSYGGGPRYVGALPPAGDTTAMAASTAELADREARMKADPMLRGGIPSVNDVKQYRLYQRHLDDAIAGPERGAVIARLDALVSLVPPADFSELRYYEDDPTVYRIGAKGGHSFNDEVPATEGMAFLVARTKTADGFEGDVNLISYYLEHKGELAAHKPEALAALTHLSEIAKHETDAEMRDLLNEQLRDYKKQLR